MTATGHDLMAADRFFLHAPDGLRGRIPQIVEWKGRHRVPGDDAIPADLRIDRVYLVSCKYLSRIVLNAGPVRLFDRGLIGGRPLRSRALPEGCREPWLSLCTAVSLRSAHRWNESMARRRQQLEVLWRMLRVSGATYFILGASRAASLRLRVGSKWDWLQDFELMQLQANPRQSGQPEVGWRATIRRRTEDTMLEVTGHVEVRWSHGRFNGLPEAKVYLDTPHAETPGYYSLAEAAPGAQRLF
jgi:hypothetical protein